MSTPQPTSVDPRVRRFPCFSRWNCHWRVVCASAGAALGCWLLFSSSSEPQYQGRPLSQWLEGSFYFDSKTGGLLTGSEPFKAAMQAMGTNALPHLVGMLSRRSLVPETLIIQRLGSMNGRWVNRLGLSKAWFQRRRAVSGFAALGERATNAIPGILKAGLSGEMVNALEAIGPAGFTIVLKEIESENESVRFNGLFGLQAQAYDRNAAARVWLHYTKDASPRVRGAATLLLWAAPETFKTKVLARLNELQSDSDTRVATFAKWTHQRVISSPHQSDVTLLP